jgi:hypothetical protein
MLARTAWATASPTWASYPRPTWLNVLNSLVAKNRLKALAGELR